MALISNEPVRILLVEQQPAIQRLFTAATNRRLGCTLATASDAGADILSLVLQLQPHVILLDIATPGLDGPATTERLLRQCPDAQVIAIAAPNDAERLLDHLCAGVQACLPTDADADELVEAIGAVAQGRSYLAPGVARALLTEIRRFRRARPTRETSLDVEAEPLTDRESDVLALVVDGKTNKHIARSLELAEGTVKNYVSRILEKLNVRNRTELAARTLGRRC